ncbi:fimbria/pilus outer membrane usher protein [Pseudocitrobacter corydidari]
MSAIVRKKRITLHKIACFVALQCTISLLNPANAREYFNPALLGIDGPGKGLTDLSSFQEGPGQMPGTYRVDVILNRVGQGTHDITFTLQKDKNGEMILAPCFNLAQLNAFGVRTEQYPALAGDNACVNLSAIPAAKTEFVFTRQQLTVEIPQAAMNNQARGYVAPERLDEGITALLLNYSLTGSHSQARNSGAPDSDSYYLNLRPGLNMGPWRIRNYSTWTRNASDEDSQESWDSVFTYAQRNIISLKSQLTLGESSTPADLFDGVPFRGIQLASDDDMLPDSLRGYAPVVRGIARSNAQVTIRQNGYTIYQTYVSPGAFEITDMYPTGSSGDLDVIIKETDGSEQHLIIPFASLPVLQREGRLKYSLTSGQYRPSEGDIDDAFFAQATAIYGLPAGFTAYSGGQLAEHYQSVLLGLGKNFGTMGAASIDATQAWSQQQDKDDASGQSVRIRYSKNILQTGTNISIAGYRYSTSGFYTLQDVLDTWRSNTSSSIIERRKNREELILSQNLWEKGGSLSLSAVSEDYWNSDRKMRSLGVGYSNNWAGITYSLNYSYNRNTTDRTDKNKVYDQDQILSFNISVPLDRWLKNSWANYTLNTSKQGYTSHTVGINGTALDDQNLNWGVQESQTDQGQGNGGNASLDYAGTYARINAAYSYDHDQRRLNYGIEGGVVAHEHGVTFSQMLGETVALVEAPGAGGVNINNQTGVNTDFRGYTIVPYISPYRENTISLNTEALPENADVELSSRTVTPTRGAIARANFNIRVGNRVLINLRKASGEVVPFGAVVTLLNNENTNSFIVGDDGQVYMTGMPVRGLLAVKWGNKATQNCQVEFNLTQNQSTNSVLESQGRCK